MRDRVRSRLSPFWTLQIGGWAAYGTLIVITLAPTLHDVSLAFLTGVKVVRTAMGFSVSLALRALYKHLRARGVSATALATAVIVFVPVAAVAWASGYRAFSLSMNPANGPFTNWPGFARDTLDYAFVLLAWSASYLGIVYWQDLQREKERALEASALAHRSQLEMLRYQLNPHFLFNALNSIRASIDEDAARSKRMITELSEFLRYSLLDPTTADVTLGEEIQAIKNYLSIERLRFEDKLDVTFDVEPGAERARLPSFILHPLVENAVKHGMRSGPTTLHVRVAARLDADHLHVEVANTGRLAADRATAPAGTGTGLRNIRERLEVVSQGAGSFAIVEQDGWIRAVLDIPR